MEQLRCVLGIIVYFIGYSSSVDYDTVTNLGEGCNWKQAMKACESKGRSLPKVPILSNGFGQINIRHENRCIWLKATYERAHNLTDYSNPNSCCELMFRDKIENAQKDCVRCKGQYRYFCASGSNNISLEYSNNLKQATWQDADHECSTHSLGLPSDTNTEFLQHLKYNGGAMWINGVRTLNTNPTKSDGMFPLCSCNGLVDLTCPSNTWTYCLLDPKNEERNGSSYFTTPVSISSNVPNLSSGDSSITETTKESMSTERFWTSYFTSPLSSSLNVSKTSTESLQDANALDTTQTPRGDVRENKALIGGVAGAGVVLTMIIIIVVVFLLRRSKQTQNKNSNSQSLVNNDNLLKAKKHLNPPYDDVNGDVPNTGKHASIQIQHMEKESITYATTNKLPGSSENTRENCNGITTIEEQSRTDVYSEVQKRAKAGKNLHTMNLNAVGDDEYDKINFDKSYQPQQAEHSKDVYDQTDFCCENQKEILENVYNKAEFYHKHQNVDAGNVYDKPNFDGEHTDYDKPIFDGEQQNKHSEIAHASEKSASPGQRSTYNYAKAYFHRRPNDESSGDAYDTIKLQL